MFKKLSHETIYGHKKKVCLEQNISIGSRCMELGHFMLHFPTFHNVSIYILNSGHPKKKLVMSDVKITKLLVKLQKAEP